MDIMALLEGLGVMAVAPLIAVYLHQSFVKMTQSMMSQMLDECKADREVFKQAVDKLDMRIAMVEQAVRDQRNNSK